MSSKPNSGQVASGGGHGIATKALQKLCDTTLCYLQWHSGEILDSNFATAGYFQWMLTREEHNGEEAIQVCLHERTLFDDGHGMTQIYRRSGTEPWMLTDGDILRQTRKVKTLDLPSPFAVLAVKSHRVAADKLDACTPHSTKYLLVFTIAQPLTRVAKRNTQRDDEQK